MEQGRRFKRKVGDRGQVTIPIDLREEFGLRNGEEVVFTVEEEDKIALSSAESNEKLAAAYQRTAERDKQVNSDWEYVSVEATNEVASDEFETSDSLDYSFDEKKDVQAGVPEIDRLVSELSVSRTIQEIASVICRHALSENLTQRCSVEAVATAAVYAACRKEGSPRSLEEISEKSQVNRKEIGRTYRYISQGLNLEVRPVSPRQYIPRFCSELELSEEVQNRAIEIIETTAEKGLLSGKSPTGYAAAAIYAASNLCNEKKTQSEIANVAQVSEVTIRNRYQDLINEIGVDSSLGAEE